MTIKRFPTLACSVVFCFALAQPVHSDDLFNASPWSAMSADRRASQVGDSLSVVVMHNAEARNSAARSQSSNGSLGANVNGGSVSESVDLNFARDGSGRGEVRRSERVAAEISVLVTEVLSNGDLKLSGEQFVDLNGEATLISVSGQVRASDIHSDNRVLSSRLANARIAYNGQTFGQRGKRPRFVTRIFNWLGLGQ
jgi:flagellar L-ring protein FlgH